MILNVCTGEVSTPPLAVPPSSLSLTLTVATPTASVGRRKRECSVPGNRRLHREPLGMVGAEQEIDQLACLVRRTGRNLRRPALDDLGTSVVSHGDVLPLAESRCIVDGRDDDRERQGVRCIAAAVLRAAVVFGLDRHLGRAEGILGRGERQRPIRRQSPAASKTASDCRW